MRKPFVLTLTVLNAIVLLGQIWPEGAPFARAINILFLCGSMLFFINWLRLHKRP